MTQTNIRQNGFVFAPLGLHADVQIQKYLQIEEALQLLPRGRADLLDHVPALPDDDRLLRLALDDNRAVEAQEAAWRFRFLEPVDDNRARKWNLGVREAEDLLAHDFGGEKTLGLIGQVLGRIPRLALGQLIDDCPLETVHVVPGRGRHRDDLREVRQLRIAIHDRQELRFPEQVDLVQNEKRRGAY